MKKAPLSWRIKNSLRWGYITGWAGAMLAKYIPKLSRGSAMGAAGELHAKYIFADGTNVEYGTLGRRKVTSDFVNRLVDHFTGNASTDFDGSFKFHGAGTDNTAEAASDTALVSEVAGVRATGTAATDSAGANIYKSVGTVAFTSTAGIVEHGLFNSSAGGYLMDRTVFAEIAVSSDDSIEFTYKLTVYASG